MGLGWAGRGGLERGGPGPWLGWAVLRCAVAGAGAGVCAGARSERRRNPNQVLDFLYFLSSYRRRRSFESGLKMKGQAQTTVIYYAKPKKRTYKRGTLTRRKNILKPIKGVPVRRTVVSVNY